MSIVLSLKIPDNIFAHLVNICMYGVRKRSNIYNSLVAKLLYTLQHSSVCPFILFLMVRCKDHVDLKCNYKYFVLFFIKIFLK